MAALIATIVWLVLLILTTAFMAGAKIVNRLEDDEDQKKETK